MQDDELGSNKSDEGEDKGGEIPSENRLSDKTAEGQEGEPSSPPVFFYVDLHLKKKKCVCDASCDLQYVFLVSAAETAKARVASEVCANEIAVAESEQTASQRGEWPQTHPRERFFFSDQS